MKRRATFFAAGYPDVSAVRLGNASRNGEADACSGCCMAMIQTAVEPLEDAIAVFHSDDRPVALY